MHSLLVDADRIAEKAHSSQVRKGTDEPYIEHPRRVSHLAHMCGLSLEIQAAALLHDVVEDTPVGLKEIAAVMPPRVVALVHLLSKWWPDGGDTVQVVAHKRRYYAAIAADEDAVMLKLLDRADNMSDMCLLSYAGNHHGWLVRYAQKTLSEINPLATLCQSASVTKTYRLSYEAFITTIFKL